MGQENFGNVRVKRERAFRRFSFGRVDFSLDVAALDLDREVFEAGLRFLCVLR